MKVAIVVGTRPEIIRLSATIKLAKQIFNTVLIHTGQNYDPNLNDVFFTDLELDPPDFYLDCSRDNPGSAIGDIITKSYSLFVDIKPDALLILGDTNSCLCAYSAKRLKVPIFHMEAGHRCFDPNVPEEINRKIIDHVADVNICYMEHARRNLLQEGLKSQYIFVMGSPLREVLNGIIDKINASNILEKLSLQPGEYFVVSTHREENVDNITTFLSIVDCINNISSDYNKKVVVSVHPRTKKRITEHGISFNPNVQLCEPFGLVDYCKLQKSAICVVSDSGTVTEESSILQFKAVLLRSSTEHPEGLDAGNIALSDTSWTNLKQALRRTINQEKKWNTITEYDAVDVSNRICNIVSSYTSIINKFVWLKR